MASASNEIDNRAEWRLDDILNDQHESSEFYRNNVIVIDPLKCYSSEEEDDDDNNGDDDQEESIDLPSYNRFANAQHTSTATPAVAQKPMTMPSNNFGAFKPSANRMNFEDVRPLRNVCFCKYCEAPFAHRNDCEAHENEHDRILPYACKFCSFLCDNQIRFIEHIRNFHDPERPFYCTQCDKHFGRRADLRKHGVSHTGIRPFACPICKKSFPRKTNVISHMKIHEGSNRLPAMDFMQQQKGPTPTKKLQQQQPPPKIAYGLPPAAAGFAYPSSSTMMPMPIDAFQPPYPPYPNQMHPNASAHFPAQENVVYSKCAMKSEPNKIPKLKIKFKLQKSPNAGAIKKFDCITCKKAFKTKRDLDRHNQIHNGMKFQCSICQKGFTRRDKLVRHEKTHANRSKTAALPESAFLPENLKRSHFVTEQKPSASSAATAGPTHEQQQQQHAFNSNIFRPQFYAEYDLSETNN